MGGLKTIQNNFENLITSPFFHSLIHINNDIKKEFKFEKLLEIFLLLRL